MMMMMMMMMICLFFLWHDLSMHIVLFQVRN